MKTATMFCLGFCFFLQLFSATALGQGASLRGRVTDSAGNNVSSATVALYKIEGLKEMARQTVTDSAGNYFLTADTGRYLLKTSHSSFITVSTQVTLGSEKKSANITLYTAARSLQTVTVKTKRPVIEQGEGKVTYNAEADPAAKTESASDLLRKTPFVTVDGEGNVQVNGQADFKILLNGRPTSLFARNLNDALKNFPASVISKIEVVVAASARHDAEGSGGIVNIITKKKTAGYNATLNTTCNSFSKYGGNGSVNARMGRITLSGYVSTSRYGQYLTTCVFSETMPLTTAVYSKRTLDGEKKHRSESLDANAELAYDVDSLTVVAVYGGTDNYRSRDLFAQTVLTDFFGQATQAGLLNRDNDYTSPGNEAGLDFIRKFRNTPEKELTFHFNTQGYRDRYVIATAQLEPTLNRWVLSNTEAKNREYTFQLDFVLPLAEGQKMEAGAKAILRSESSDYKSWLKHGPAEAFVPDPSNSDRFRYRQSVYSLYASYNLHRDHRSLTAGLRAERTVVNGNFITVKTAIRQDYINLIPDVLFSQKFTSLYTLTVGYNLRLHRPSIVSLNPFVDNSDSFNRSFGNPDLKAQVLHVAALQNRFEWSRFFIVVGFSGSFTNNLVLPYASFDPKTGITAVTKANVGRERQGMVSLNMGASPGGKLNLDVNALLRYNKVENAVDLLQHREGLSGSLTANLRYKLSGAQSLSASGGILRNPYALLNSPSGQYFYQLAFRQKLAHDKLAVTVNANNFFARSFDYRNETTDPSFRILTVNANPFRLLSIGATYNFGKLKGGVSKKRGVANDDKLPETQSQ